jgi:hypothetical protein
MARCQPKPQTFRLNFAPPQISGNIFAHFPHLEAKIMKKLRKVSKMFKTGPNCPVVFFSRETPVITQYQPERLLNVQFALKKGEKTLRINFVEFFFAFRLKMAAAVLKVKCNNPNISYHIIKNPAFSYHRSPR